MGGGNCNEPALGGPSLQKVENPCNRAPLGYGGMGDFFIMDLQPTNLKQLRDAIMSMWTKISEECFQHLVKESMPQRIKAVLKVKGGPTRY